MKKSRNRRKQWIHSRWTKNSEYTVGELIIVKGGYFNNSPQNNNKKKIKINKKWDEVYKMSLSVNWS